MTLLPVEGIIKNKLQNDQWETLVLDGTTPPVTDSIRKQLKHLKKSSNQCNNSMKSSIPIVIAFFFETGSIPVRSYRRIHQKKNNHDEHDLNSIDRPSSSNLASERKSSIENFVSKQIDAIKNMAIDEEKMYPLSTETVKIPSLVNNEPVALRSIDLPSTSMSFGLTNLNDVLSKPDAPTDIGELLPSINVLSDLSNDLFPNRVAPTVIEKESISMDVVALFNDDVSAHHVSRTNFKENMNYDMNNSLNQHTFFDANAIDDLPEDLFCLREDNNKILNDLDMKISRCEKHMEKIQSELKKLVLTLKKTVKQRKEKEQEFNKEFKIRYDAWRNKRSNLKSHEKALKRLSTK